MIFGPRVKWCTARPIKSDRMAICAITVTGMGADKSQAMSRHGPLYYESHCHGGQRVTSHVTTWAIILTQSLSQGPTCHEPCHDTGHCTITVTVQGADLSQSMSGHGPSYYHSHCHGGLTSRLILVINWTDWTGSVEYPAIAGYLPISTHWTLHETTIGGIYVWDGGR